MLKNLLTSALFAGFGAGIIVSALYLTMVVPLVLGAEVFESGGSTEMGLNIEVEQDWARNFKTALGTIATYTGFALLMVSGFALAERKGVKVSARQGILWGVAGFYAFHMAPAFGIPPEPPGTYDADLLTRQIWWTSTVAASIVGLAAIAFGKNWAHWGVGIVLITLPHIIGAPDPDYIGGSVPPEIASRFVGVALASNLAGWTLLGLFAGYFWIQERSPSGT